MDLSTQRVVDCFPIPYSLASPYSSLAFDQEIRDYCDQNVNLSVSDPFSKCAKVILVGDMAVGKTCLLNRFTYDTFGLDHKATIGVDFAIIRFNILQVPFQLQVWDTAGQERFQSIAENYYRNAHAAIICFDLSNISSLKSVNTWVSRIISGNKGNKVPLVFLVGTKLDCIADSVVEFVETEALKVAASLSAEYWSVSSRTGYNVENFFKRVAALSFSEIILTSIDRMKEDKESQAVQYSAKFVKLNKKKKFTLIKACMVNKCVYKK